MVTRLHRYAILSALLVVVVLVTLFEYETTLGNNKFDFDAHLLQDSQQQRRLDSLTTTGHNTALLRGRSKVKVSLVTSFSVKAEGAAAANNFEPHRLETKAAILANVHNPHFDQVVVFLDGVSEDAKCQQFLVGLKELDVRLGLAPMNQEHRFSKLSKLTCVDVTGEQPTYYQMFQNALSDYVTGDVVVLADEDQAFDHTISLARHLNPEVLAVLGTRGFSKKKVPPLTNYFYSTLVGTGLESLSDPDQCVVGSSRSSSFNTFIFHKHTIKDRLQEEDFQRPTTNNEMMSFYMNDIGAGNAALYAVQQSYPFTSVYNACERIHSWHFHLTPNTYKFREVGWSSPLAAEGNVAPKKDPPCAKANNCFLVDKKVM